MNENSLTDGVGADRAKLLHATWIEEYKALRAEILQLGISARQGTQVAIVAIAAGVSLAGYVVGQDLPILFLICPVAFHALAWAQLRYAFLSHSMSRYVQGTVGPGTRVALGLVEKPEEPWPLGWDKVARESLNARRRRLWIIEAASILLPLCSAVLLPIAYFFYVSHCHAVISIYGRLWILLNEGLCIYTIMMANWVRRYRAGETDLSAPGSLPAYCDLTAVQLVHYVVNGAVRIRCCFRKIPAPSEQAWYPNPVKDIFYFYYRLGRWTLWGIIAIFTLLRINAYNVDQEADYAAHHETLRLVGGRTVDGRVIYYNGRNIVIMVDGNKEEIDTSLLADLPLAPAQATPQATHKVPKSPKVKRRTH